MIDVINKNGKDYCKPGDLNFGIKNLNCGSPKKPALIEAVALNFADNTDAKLETMKEILSNAGTTSW